MAKRYKDGGMLNDKESRMSPGKEVIMRGYPDPYSFLPGDILNDDISGIDTQIKGDSPVRKGGFKPAKL